MSWFETVITFFQSGGLFMYPIMLLFAIGIAIAIERYLFLTASVHDSQHVWQEVMPLVRTSRIKDAIEAATSQETAMGRILSYGLSRSESASARDDVELAMEEGLMEVMPQLERRTHYLATFANIATLLGLLGTIIGLIQGFTAISNVNPAEKADLLSRSISVAMNTTAFGLMVAIPLLLLHAFLQARTTELIDSLEMASVKFLNSLTDKQNGQ